MPNTFTQIPGHEWATIVFVGVWVVTFLGIHIRWSRRNSRILLDPIFGLAAVVVSLIPAALAGLVAVLFLATGLGAAIAQLPDAAVSIMTAINSGNPAAVLLFAIVFLIVVGFGVAFLTSELTAYLRAAEDVRRANPLIVGNKRLYHERIRARAAEIRAGWATARRQRLSRREVRAHGSLSAPADSE